MVSETVLLCSGFGWVMSECSKAQKKIKASMSQ